MVTQCSVENGVVTIEVKVDISGSMLDAEENIQRALSEVGSAITREALKSFDTDAPPIVTGAIKGVSKRSRKKKWRL